jgi:hypothetical protein
MVKTLSNADCIAKLVASQSWEAVAGIDASTICAGGAGTGTDVIIFGNLFLEKLCLKMCFFFL